MYVLCFLLNIHVELKILYHFISPLLLSCSGARSEALASAQLELHGLQDMLDNLTTWITDAEAKLSEAEAMPISMDLEKVEQQLAEHEVSSPYNSHTVKSYIHSYHIP